MSGVPVGSAVPADDSGRVGPGMRSEGVGAAAGRGRSHTAARRHSALVRVLKFTIPFGAVVTVAMVVAGSLFNPLGRIPGLTLGPVSFHGSKIAMERPRLTGYRKDQRPYEVTASAAFQDIRKPTLIELKDMRARLAVDGSGAMANLVSEAGLFDTSKEHLDLTRNIRVWTDKGEEILLRSASVEFKSGRASSREPIKITTPTLILEADAMDLSDNGQTISFTGRVRAQLLRGIEAKPAEAGSKPPRITQAEAGEAR